MMLCITTKHEEKTTQQPLLQFWSAAWSAVLAAYCRLLRGSLITTKSLEIIEEGRDKINAYWLNAVKPFRVAALLLQRVCCLSSLHPPGRVRSKLARERERSPFRSNFEHLKFKPERPMGMLRPSQSLRLCTSNHFVGVRQTCSCKWYYRTRLRTQVPRLYAGWNAFRQRFCVDRFSISIPLRLALSNRIPWPLSRDNNKLA